MPRIQERCVFQFTYNGCICKAQTNQRSCAGACVRIGEPTCLITMFLAILIALLSHLCGRFKHCPHAWAECLQLSWPANAEQQHVRDFLFQPRPSIGANGIMLYEGLASRWTVDNQTLLMPEPFEYGTALDPPAMMPVTFCAAALQREPAP